MESLVNPVARAKRICSARLRPSQKVGTMEDGNGRNLPNLQTQHHQFRAYIPRVTICVESEVTYGLEHHKGHRGYLVKR